MSRLRFLLAVTAAAALLSCRLACSQEPVVTFGPETATASLRNWHLDPALGLRTRDNGAWVRWRFTGTAATVLMDVSAYAGQLVRSYPGLQWELDAAAGRIQTAAGVTEYPLPVTGPGPHELRLWHEISDHQLNHWAADGVELRLLGLRCEADAALLPVTESETILALGDSILSATSQIPKPADFRHNPRSSWFWLHALGRQQEACIVSKPGTGWVSATPRLPAFHVPGQPAASSWRWLWEGQPAPTVLPARVIVAHGHNDGNASPSLVSSRVTDWLTQARAEWPAARLELLIPFSQRQAAAITAGYQAYQLAHPEDANTRLRDLGPLVGFNSDLGPGVATSRTSDGTHPTAAGHALVATLFTKATVP